MLQILQYLTLEYLIFILLLCQFLQVNLFRHIILLRLLILHDVDHPKPTLSNHVKSLTNLFILLLERQQIRPILFYIISVAKVADLEREATHGGVSDLLDGLVLQVVFDTELVHLLCEALHVL